jgi:hypothetical protein
VKPTAAALAVLVASAGTALAQLGRDPSAELDALRRTQANKQSEVDRLVDRRFRLDLGLPLGEDPTRATVAPMSTAERERRLRELDEIESSTQTYKERFAKVRRTLEELRAEIEARNAEQRERESFVVVPAPGAALPVPAAPAAGRSGESPAPAPQGQEPAPLPVEHDPAVRLDRVRGWIRGSQDHLRVARSLLEAGQRSMEIAAQEHANGNTAAADEFEARAKDRLERAVAELEPLLEVAQPEFAALFCKGRCLEQLFRHAVRHDGLSLQNSTKTYQQREQEVREPFLAIAARDVTKGGAQGDVDVLGPWGRAAQAAVEHFRWMNAHASFAPATPIESLTWPGEKDK